MGVEIAMPETTVAELQPQTSLGATAPSVECRADCASPDLALPAALAASAASAMRVTGIRAAMKQPSIPLTVLSGDRLLCRLAALRDSIAVPMARAAFAITKREAWIACGYQNTFDFARERLDRDQRWLHNLVRLHETLETHPAVAAALCGTDGGTLLGQMAAIQIGRVATASDVGSWIDRARHIPFAELRTEVARHLACATEPTPGDEPGSAAPVSRFETSPEDALDEPRVLVRQMVPPDIKIIFDDALELYRAVAGLDAGPTAFVEALGAEVTSSGLALPEDYHPRLRRNDPKRTGQIWNHLSAGVTAKRAIEGLGTGLGPISELASPATRNAHRHLTESAELQTRLERLERKLAIEFGGASQAGNSDVDGTGASAETEVTVEAGDEFGVEIMDGVATATAAWVVDGIAHARVQVLSWSRKRDLKRLAGVLGTLIRLQNTIEMDIADLLLELDENRAWKWLGFEDLEHYAEERLGMGRSTARKRVWLARSLRHRSEIRGAFEDGVLGLVATQCAVVALRNARPDPALQKQWIENARDRTVKGLWDDIRLVKRNHLLRCVDVARSLTPLAPRFPGRGPAESTSAPRFPGRGAAESTSAPRFPGPRVADAVDDRNAPRFPPPDPRAPHLFAPPSDADWRASLRFGPGQTFDSVFGLGYGLLERVVHRGPLMQVPLAFHLPETEASTFLRSIEAARRVLVDRVQSSPEPGEQSRFTPAARIAQDYVHNGERVPSWVGLLALLEEWVMVHDALKSDGTRPVLRRDHYRCMAPGCTARVNVQVHHLYYRGWGGDNAPENLLVLCELCRIRHNSHYADFRIMPRRCVWPLRMAEIVPRNAA